MSLSIIIQSKISDAFAKHGAFYAFSDEQFQKSKVEGVTYVSMIGGLICPKQNAEKLHEEMADITKQGIQDDLKINGRRKIIIRELYNYECFYVGCVDDCVDALAGYEIHREDILKVYYEVLPTVDL